MCEYMFGCVCIYIVVVVDRGVLCLYLYVNCVYYFYLYTPLPTPISTLLSSILPTLLSYIYTYIYTSNYTSCLYSSYFR